MLPSHKTRIVATIGPASDVPDVLEAMIRAGMNVARLNFSHGKFEEHAARIERLRTAAAAAGREIALLADLPGPKMRIGELETEPIELAKGQPFTLTTDEIVGDETRASVSFARLPQAVKPGDRLLLNDGLVQILVREVSGPEVRCEVQVGGSCAPARASTCPGSTSGSPPLPTATGSAWPSPSSAAWTSSANRSSSRGPTSGRSGRRPRSWGTSPS